MMHSGFVRARSAVVALAVLLALRCGTCPGARRRPQAPVPVNELVELAGRMARRRTAFPQYWKRNTLVVDLQGAAGTGSSCSSRRDGAQVAGAHRVPRDARLDRAARSAGGSAHADARDARGHEGGRSRAGARRLHRQDAADHGASGNRSRRARSIVDGLIAAAGACSRGCARSSSRFERGERAAPDAAGIEPDHAVLLHKPERGPVPEDHARVAAVRGCSCSNHGAPRRAHLVRAALHLEIDASFAQCRRAVA